MKIKGTFKWMSQTKNMQQMKHVQRKNRRKKKRREMYLKLRFIKQNGAGD